MADWNTRDRAADEGGGAERQARQHRLGRLNARERIALLVDKDSFQEMGRHVKTRNADRSSRIALNQAPGDGLVCGLASVEGRNVAVYAHDPTVMRGAFGHQAALKLCRLLDLAFERRLPVLCLADSEGVRVEEGLDAVSSFGEVISRTVRLRSRVPQLTLVCGLCVGGAAYTAVLTDCVGMVEHQSFMFVTGDKVARTVTGTGGALDELGGWDVHSKVTGAAHAVLPDEQAGIAWLRRVMTFLVPRVVSEDSPGRQVPELEELIPTNLRQPYDMRRVLEVIVDRGSLLEHSALFAPNLLTAFARLNGRRVAIVASQPKEHAGCLDVHSSRKGAAFVEWAARWGMPIVTLVDVPGYLPGKEQEAAGILPHGSTLLMAYGNARVPKLCLVVRKSYGGASVLSYAADVRLGFPTARVNPMGPEATLQVVLGEEPVNASEDLRAQRERQRNAWLQEHDSAWAAAEAGYLDKVIRPASARQELCALMARLSEESV